MKMIYDYFERELNSFLLGIHQILRVWWIPFLQFNSPFCLNSPLFILFALRLNDLKLIPEVVQNPDYRIYSGVDPLSQGPDQLRAIHVHAHCHLPD